MKKTYYHATPMKNRESILQNGIKVGCDGVTYLTETKEDSIKFLIARDMDGFYIIEVLLEEDQVEESFDHDMDFFKCRAFSYAELIKREEMTAFYIYIKKFNRFMEE